MEGKKKKLRLSNIVPHSEMIRIRMVIIINIAGNDTGN